MLRFSRADFLWSNVRFWLRCLALVWAGPLTAVWSAPSADEPELLRLTREFERTLEGNGDAVALAGLLHPAYAYTGPELPAADLGDVTLAGRRIALGGGRGEALAVRMAGSTAVVTGGYRTDQKSRNPRIVGHGRFTMTWVREGGRWLVLAEHRSLGDEREVAKAKTPSNVEAKSGPAAFAATIAATPGSLRLSQVFRPYEPTQIGYTFDEGDDAFMDFKFSVMFPIFEPKRPDADVGFLRSLGYTKPHVYFAGTVRAAQYIGTRPSSPVVGKRFNPLLAVRFWGTDLAEGAESGENFLELAYGHESNGQFIASRARFEEQLQVYLNQARDAATPAEAAIARKAAFLSARDNISRGWDYLGLQYARDWDTELPWASEVKVAFRAGFNYFLPRGVFQGGAEEYNAWEVDPEGKRRRQVDGLTFRYALTAVTPQALTGAAARWADFLEFERRYVLTWTTGYQDPFRFNTVKVEAGLKLYGLPLTVWYRYGYNSDLIDYYRRDHSFGLMLSFWTF